MLRWARRGLEVCSRRVVLRRYLPTPCERVQILVSPGAQLNYWRRDLHRVDPNLLDLAVETVSDADVVWDVGASLGLFTFQAACISGRRGAVVAIEPDPWAARLLERTAAKNAGNTAPVEIVPVALADTSGARSFVIAKRGRAASHLLGYGGTQAGGARRTFQVPTMTLDTLTDKCPHPQVVKIDVEGAELEVLKGGERLLDAIRPKFILEVSSSCQEDVSKLLRSHDYDLFDASLPRERRLSLDKATWMTLALPSE